MNDFLYSNIYLLCEVFNFKVFCISVFVLPMGKLSTADKGRTTNNAAKLPGRSQSHYILASHINGNTPLSSTQINTISTAAGKKAVMGDASSPLSSALSSPFTSAKSQGPSLSLESDTTVPSNDEAAVAPIITSPNAASIAAPGTREDQVARQDSKRMPEELATDNDERPKRRKIVTTDPVDAAQSAPVEAEDPDEATVGVEAADEGKTTSADEPAESKETPSKSKLKAKAASKKKAAPSRRGPPACPECKRRKV